MSEAKLSVEVVSRLSPLWKGMATYVSIPAVDGRLGILKGRQPILAVLEPGTVEIDADNGNKVTVAISGGFASVDSDFVTIVAEGGDVTSSQH
ncbi:F0F1 ATP synthase subunit epsilon [Actinomyces minihominis]|uniref:F0F1 ATP synthase subunit epsilon n=1 Tax=Actinomyces minihominis TaxID=2002838 RepID=UPI001F5E20B4|nr:F0F1 ATP synthase subunit epsilon [Actinomyces minihominis]